MSTFRDIQTKFNSSGILAQLIYINIAVFIVTSLAGLFGPAGDLFFLEWFALSSSFDVFIFKPWTIITFGFLHGGFLHILFNLIWLYFFGRLFLDYFTPKQLLNFYLLGTLFGGIAYMLSYNTFPIFEGRVAPIVGASAGVSAIVVGLAAYIPNYQINLRFIGYVKIWHIAAFFIFIDLISLAGSNGGGHFSHLGGALFGYFYVRQAGNKKSSKSSGSFSSIFKRKKKPLKTVYNSKKKTAPTPKNVKSDTQKKVDDILDKISKSGYDTLSKEEKDFLFKQRK